MKENVYSWPLIIRYLIRFLGKNSRKYFVLSVILFLAYAYMLVPPYIIGRMVDFFTQYHAGESLFPFYMLCVVLGGLHFVTAIIRLKAKNILNNIAIETSHEIKTLCFERLVRGSLAWNRKEHSGNRIQTILTGSNAIRDTIAIFFDDVYLSIASFVSVTIVLVLLSPAFAVLFGIYTTIFFLTLRWFNARIMQLNEEANHSNEKTSGTLIEASANMYIIQASNAKNEILGKVRETQKSTGDLFIKKSNYSFRRIYFLQLVTGLLYVVFPIIVGGEVLAGTLTAGTIFVYFMYLNDMTMSITRLISASNRFIDFRSDLGRLIKVFFENSEQKHSYKMFPPSWDTIRFHDVLFSYEADKTVLDRFSAVIERNSIVGIRGHSGSGKSTVARILMRLYEPERGSIFIGKEEISGISPDEIGKNIAMVLQEIELFNLSLLENITMMRKVLPEQVKEAIRIARLESVIAKLPEGIETHLGEKGHKLSAGERQRIGIARALCTEAPIIILDEATASLDQKTSREIMEDMIRSCRGKRTFLIIAHKMEDLRFCDSIITMDHGKNTEVVKKTEGAEIVETLIAPHLEYKNA